MFFIQLARRLAKSPFLKTRGFPMLIGWCFCTMLGYHIAIFRLANYPDEIGFSSSRAVLASALSNLAQATGRPTIGCYRDTLGRIHRAGMTTLLAGKLSLTIWIVAKNNAILLLFIVTEASWQATSGPRSARRSL